MVDVVDAATRSRMMSGIRGKNTKPELAVRSNLHRMGLRFSLTDSRLAGKPDLVMPRHKTVVFVHGCFWHCHNCSNFRWPTSNTLFWRDKLQGNATRDKRYVRELHLLGWRVLVIWECAVRQATKAASSNLYVLAHDWVVNYDSPYLEISKRRDGGFSKRRTTARSL